MRAAKSDEHLARAAGRGDVAAFEALYERHHRALLSFSRHMLGRAHDAEDVVQHTFLAADRAFRDGKAPKAVRAWLYTVARNRCVSLLRGRRDDAGLPDAGVPSTENLVADVEQRDDLRALLGDLRALPDDQRAALLLAELGDLSHVEVGKVIGVRAGKVKALVFQAREALLASAHARTIPCHSIREELATASGAALRRRHLKHHLAQCAGCTAFAADVRTQRAALAALLPVVPTIALREGVFAGLASGGAAAGAGAGIGAGILANSTAAKLLTTLAVGGAAAGGGIAVTELESPAGRKPAERRLERVRTAPAPVAPAGISGPGESARERPGSVAETHAERARGERAAREEQARDARPGDAPGRRERDRERPQRSDTPAPRGRPAAAGNGHGRESAPGQLKAPKEKPPKTAVPKGKAKAKAPKVEVAPKPAKVKAPKAKPAPEPPKPKPPKPEASPERAAPPEPAAPLEAAADPLPDAAKIPPGQAAKG